MRIRINVFPGIQNLPNLVAGQHGFFQAWEVEVETVFTRSSQQQRDALAGDGCDLAHSAVDNALALADAGVDVAIVMGLDAGFNKLVVQPGIDSHEQLRGRVFGVDAPDTAFALLGYEMLRRAGLHRDRDYAVRVVGATGQRLRALQDGEIDFALLNLPFNLSAQASGLRLLGDPLDAVGPYQSTGAFVRRDWAAAHPDLLQRYIAAYVQGLRWTLDPGNRDGVLAVLQGQLELDPEVALSCYRDTCQSPRGFHADAILDPQGMIRVAALRDAFSPRPGHPPRDPNAYCDDSFHRRALLMLDKPTPTTASPPRPASA